MPSNVIIECTS